VALGVADHDGALRRHRRQLAHPVGQKRQRLARQGGDDVFAQAHRADRGARRAAKRRLAEVGPEQRPEHRRRDIDARARAVRRQPGRVPHRRGREDRVRVAAAQGGADRRVELVDRRQQLAALAEDGAVALASLGERGVGQVAAAHRERAGVRPEHDRARDRLDGDRLDHRLASPLPRVAQDRRGQAAHALDAGEVVERLALGGRRRDPAAPGRGHIAARALQVHHHHRRVGRVERLLERAVDGAGRVARHERVVGAQYGAMHAEDRHHRDRRAILAVHADEREPVIVAAAAGQLVVLAPAVAGDRVVQVELALDQDADTGRPARLERCPGHRDELFEQGLADLPAQDAAADRELRVGRELHGCCVRVGGRKHHLARVVRPEPVSDIGCQRVVREDEVGLDENDRIARRGQGQRLDPGERLDADRRAECPRQFGAPQVDLAVRPGKTCPRRVPAKSGGDRRDQRSFGCPGGERARLDSGPTGSRGGRERLVVAVGDRGGRGGVGLGRVGGPGVRLPGAGSVDVAACTGESQKRDQPGGRRQHGVMLAWLARCLRGS
jgi:hypothetical protein